MPDTQMTPTSTRTVKVMQKQIRVTLFQSNLTYTSLSTSNLDEREG